MKKVSILTGGGDAPAHAVIRGRLSARAKKKDWEVYGSIEAFTAVLNEPQELY